MSTTAKKCPECQFESSVHGTYEYHPHAPGCTKENDSERWWEKDFDDSFGNDECDGCKKSFVGDTRHRWYCNKYGKAFIKMVESQAERRVVEASWKPMYQAPKNRDLILGLYDGEEEVLVRWAEHRTCMLGGAAGQCGPGWEDDYNHLPVEEPLAWKDECAPLLNISNNA